MKRGIKTFSSHTQWQQSQPLHRAQHCSTTLPTIQPHHHLPLLTASDRPLCRSPRSRHSLYISNSQTRISEAVQQADIMCLMLPNMDELLLEQSIFKYLSACYPEPAVTIVTCSGLPSSKASQLCLGPGVSGGLGRLMPPGLCPRMLCGSPWSIPHRFCPGSTCPGTGSRTLQTPDSSSLSDQGGSIPVSTARICPNTLGTGILWKGPQCSPTRLLQGSFRGIQHGPAKQISSGTCDFWQHLEEP